MSTGVHGSAEQAFPGESATPPVAEVIGAVHPALLDRPETPFVALHAAVALAAAGDLDRLRRLARHCRGRREATLAGTVAAACDGFEAVLERRWAVAVQILTEVMPELLGVGGSAAQREIVEETLLLSLVNAGQGGAARELLESRLHRRPSPLDQRRLRWISTTDPDLSMLVPWSPAREADEDSGVRGMVR